MKDLGIFNFNPQFFRFLEYTNNLRLKGSSGTVITIRNWTKTPSILARTSLKAPTGSEGRMSLGSTVTNHAYGGACLRVLLKPMLLVLVPNLVSVGGT